MEKYKLVGVPSNVNFKLLRLSYEEFENVQEIIEGIPYKMTIESLMYAIVVTTADLEFAISTVIHFISRIGPPHWRV